MVIADIGQTFFSLARHYLLYFALVISISRWYSIKIDVRVCSMSLDQPPILEGVGY